MNNADLIEIKELVAKYEELKSSYKVAEFFSVSATAVKRILKREGVLRTQKTAALERDNSFAGKYERTESHKKTLSEFAKKRTGENNHFFNKTHSDLTKTILSEKAKSRLSDLNPNYKNGKYLRRPRDFKIAQFSKIRNFVFNRDKFTCKLTGQVGGHLHAHHLIPYWVCPEAFLDVDNLITVSTEAHFKVCHKESWGSFNVELIPDELIIKYSLDRERLNELASFWKKR
jgi:hypothetical protein